MNKRVTKILCVAVSAVSVLGVALTAGCSKYYKGDQLTGNIFTEGKAESNGGFAVKKGEYVYFINGVEGYNAVNDFGTPVKGAIYRISESDLANHNYNKVDRVVPQVAYSGNYDAGLFVYGDYIYYATPSTERDASGAVQNTVLDLKSTKLDGSETLKEPYVQLTDNSSQYRFVEENGKVYILYVENTDSVTSLHSYNTADGVDTLLAYDVSAVMFDKTDVTNHRVYYTMNVKNYVDENNTAYSYNQIYTVTAGATEDRFKDLDTSKILGWDSENDKYVNCGDLVFEGRGRTDEKTPFNYDYEGELEQSGFTYTLQTYQNGMLFYTRVSKHNTMPYLFAFKDADLTSAALNPVTRNPAAEKRILSYSSSSDITAGNLVYIFKDDKLDFVLNAESGGGITINKAEYTGDDFVLQTKTSADEQTSLYYNIVGSSAGTASIIHVDQKYVYYTLGSGTSINRIDYTGKLSDYSINVLPSAESDYDPVQILNIQSSASWYNPEFIDGQILFASATAQVSAYNPVMACDIKDMSNADIEDLNEKFNGIEKLIGETFGDTDAYPQATYANVQNALRYAFYSGEQRSVYLNDLAKRLNDKVEEDGDPVYSDKTLALYDEFFTPAENNIWKDYTAHRNVNGVEVYANRLDYYYSVLGVMNDTDKDSYTAGLRSSYLVSEAAEENTGWWSGLSTAQKVWFVIGMVAAGLVVAGGITVAVILIVRHNRKKSPESRRRRIKVDLTDDKNIDVYGTGDGENGNQE